MRLNYTRPILAGTTIGGFFAAGAVRAQDGLEGLEVIGAPVEKGVGFQESATSLMVGISNLEGMVNVIIITISLFVMALLLYVILRYNKRSNPTPATFTHNTPIEVAWTLIPILILVFIGAFSLPQLFKQQEFPEGDVTIKVTGYQWYWGYEYVDHDFGFDSFMLAKDELAEFGYDESLHLLATDTAVVVPVNTTVLMQVTGADVIHSWAIPSFGVKQDAVPGRIAHLWFNAEKEGIYFGQCSELCGKDHSYMPITVKVVSQETYDAWLKGAIEEYAGNPASIQVAAAD